MEPTILDRLRCPVCADCLAEVTIGTTGLLRCPRRHSFDVARQGYVNLLTGRAPHSGDTAAMVAAREEFLTAGHYHVISTALADAARAATSDPARRTDQAGTTGPAGPGHAPPPGPDATGAARSAYPRLVVDAGAGTGRHLATVLAALPDAAGLALDVSKAALKRAARVRPRAAAALADTWQRLPLADASVDLLLNVFAPRNGAEFRRVLRPAGTLLVVTPAADHLIELVDALHLLRVDPGKADRVAGSLADHFTRVDTRLHRTRLTLDRREVGTLVGMGPSARHTGERLADRLAALSEPVPVTVAVRLSAYRPR